MNQDAFRLSVGFRSALKDLSVTSVGIAELPKLTNSGYLKCQSNRDNLDNHESCYHCTCKDVRRKWHIVVFANGDCSAYTVRIYQY